MYLRKSTRKYKDRTYTSYLLVESVSTPKGPRQKTICSLGDLAPKPRAQWLNIARRMHAALAGQYALFDEPPEVLEVLDTARARTRRRPSSHGARNRRSPRHTISVDPERVAVESVREAGTVHVGLAFWKRMGFDAALQGAGLSERTRVLTCAMVMNRLIAPASEHAMPAWMRRTALTELLGSDFATLSEAALYRNMDRLHPKRALIESDLVERERELFNLDQTIFFYDLTTTWIQKSTLPGCGRSGFVARRTGAAGGRRLYRNGMADGDRVLSHPHLANEQAYDTLTLGKRHCLRPFTHTPKESFHRRGQGKPRATVELRSLQRVQFRQDGTLSGL